MSRSGYSCDLDTWDLLRWRGAVASAIRGARGQKFLQDMATALDAMPSMRLVPSILVKDGECCAMGAVAMSRELDTSKIDPDDRDAVAELLDIAPALAAEIASLNDNDFCYSQTPEERWLSMRRWVAAHIK